MKVVKRLTVHERATYLGDSVFAASDGIVTTFAIVAGSAGASLSAGIVLILGFANLFADGFSMAAGNYLGVKSEVEYQRAEGRSARHEGSPFRHGMVTFFSFNISGLIPLLPYLFDTDYAFVFSTLLVALTLVTVGILRSAYTKKNMIMSGLEMLVVGGLAASVAFGVGYLIKGYVF
jgi:VIT1/CCC1 family predicted Fe2+/Mn2+ transporter